MGGRRVAPRAVRLPPADLAAVILLLGLWLVPWALLTLAAALAGGAPSVSPMELIDPRRLSRIYEADGHRVVLHHLVGSADRISLPTFWTVLVGVPLALIVSGGVVIIRIAPKRAGGAGSLPTSSRWAGRGDLRGLRVRRPRPGAFSLGRSGRRLITAADETSVLVIGPTRSGKTSGLVVPNLFEWQGPAIVTSTKSELVDITAGHRQSIGPVSVYDPTGEIAGSHRSVTWSPIAGCERLDHAWMVAAWLCAGLQQGGARSDNDWVHWAESGKLLIAPLLYAAASSADLSIVDVRAWIHSFDLATPMNLLEAMGDARAGSDDSDPARAIGMLTSIDQRPERSGARCSRR